MIGILLSTGKIKDVTKLFYGSSNPEKLALEITALKEYVVLPDADKEFLNKHININMLNYNLNNLGYCVCDNVQRSLNLIREARNKRN